VLQKAMAAVIAVLPACGLGLKWPNDLVGRHLGEMVKLGGIIGERVGERLILGLGLNLRAAPELPGRAFPAACLVDLADQIPTSEYLGTKIWEAWEDISAAPDPSFRWPAEGDPIVWDQTSSSAGQGVCLGWEPDGRLKVASATGVERLSAADVRGLR
jgi:BirA family biotin operon repressor/biotin-[acetyl-CoA-carboxylase] ligase